MFLLLTLGSYDMGTNIRSLLVGYISFWGVIEWNGLLKVCINISYRVKAIEVVLKRLLLLIHGLLGAARTHEPALYTHLWLIVDNIPNYH